MNTRWHKISGWFLWISLCHLWRAARSAAPWFGSQSHIRASPHKRYFWFSLNVFFVAGEPAIVYLFPVYLFYYLFIINYLQCQILYLFIWCCVENFIWHCAGESDVVRPSFHHIIKLPPIFINLVKVNAYGLIVPMAYPTALHKFLQGLRVWLLW